jgi:hypothetical protein
MINMTYSIGYVPKTTLPNLDALAASTSGSKRRSLQATSTTTSLKPKLSVSAPAFPTHWAEGVGAVAQRRQQLQQQADQGGPYQRRQPLASELYSASAPPFEEATRYARRALLGYDESRVDQDSWAAGFSQASLGAVRLSDLVSAARAQAQKQQQQPPSSGVTAAGRHLLSGTPSTVDPSYTAAAAYLTSGTTQHGSGSTGVMGRLSSLFSQASALLSRSGATTPGAPSVQTAGCDSWSCTHYNSSSSLFNDLVTEYEQMAADESAAPALPPHVAALTESHPQLVSAAAVLLQKDHPVTRTLSHWMAHAIAPAVHAIHDAVAEALDAIVMSSSPSPDPSFGSGAFDGVTDTHHARSLLQSSGGGSSCSSLNTSGLVITPAAAALGLAGAPTGVTATCLASSPTTDQVGGGTGWSQPGCCSLRSSVQCPCESTQVWSLRLAARVAPLAL